MPRGPAGNRRLTSVGPFTYDERDPPQLPSSFSPPDNITNAFGDRRWWERWEGVDIDQYGATMFYDPERDRVFIENRLRGPDGNKYLHDDMVEDILTKGPFGKFPDRVLPGEAGFVDFGSGPTGSAEIPTPAGGAWVMTQRLPGDKEILEEGNEVRVEWFYKLIYSMAIIDFPGDTFIQMKHRLGPRLGNVFEARRSFQLRDAYRELQFENQMPQPEVRSPEFTL